VEYTESVSAKGPISVDIRFRLGFMHFSDWIAAFATPAAGVRYTMGERATIGGVPAISVKAAAPEERSSTIWVATRGQPYPLRYSGPGGSPQVDLGEHGARVDVRKPTADQIVTPDAVEAAAAAPTPGTGPLDGAATIPLHGTARLPRRVQVTFVEAGDEPTVKAAGVNCDGTGSITTALPPGSATFACGMRIEVVTVDRGSAGRPPTIRIIYRPGG